MRKEKLTGKKENKKVEKREKGKLLDMFVKIRTTRILDGILKNSVSYQRALKQQDEAFKRMEKAGLNKEQYIIVDRVISATNYCNSIYGACAYRLGLHDGIKLISELKKIK